MHRMLLPARSLLAELPAAALRASSAARTFTAQPASLLLRDYIHEALYNPATGYFSSDDAPVGRLAQPLNFRNLLGRDGYHYALDAEYRRMQVSWLTPSEIFSPYYGGALAECILSHHLRTSPASPLEVYELGAGTGTVAKDVLDYIRQHAPDVYRDMKYSTVEISNNLADLQHDKASATAGHEAVFSTDIRDATDPEGWAEDQRPCYVIALEVLDNLPHDRVVWDGGEWQETFVSGDLYTGTLREECRTLQDPLIRRCIEALGIQPPDTKSGRSSLQWLPSWLAGTSGQDPDQGVVFLPTKCLQLIEALHSRRPNHRLLAADFSELPDIQVPGVNAPLVSNTIQGRAVDYSTYLTNPGQADIFFPTDFEGLRQMYDSVQARTAGHGYPSTPSTVSDVSDFMYSFADWKATTTISGFNPLLEDFTNTKILLGNMEARIRKHGMR